MKKLYRLEINGKFYANYASLKNANKRAKDMRDCFPRHTMFVVKNTSHGGTFELNKYWQTAINISLNRSVAVDRIAA